MQLAEVLEFLHRQGIAGEMQKRIDQHRAVTVREHEAVAIRPLRVGRVVLEEVVPQHFRDIRHAHRGAGMAGVGLLHRVHAQGTDGVGQLTAAGYCLVRFG